MEIKIPMDFIVVEQHEGDTIKKDSRLLCGCCGEQLCKMKEDLKLPFGSDELAKTIYESSYNENMFGLTHKTCGHTMFPLRRDWDFITLEDFMKYQNDYVQKLPKGKHVN